MRIESNTMYETKTHEMEGKPLFWVGFFIVYCSYLKDRRQFYTPISQKTHHHEGRILAG